MTKCQWVSPLATTGASGERTLCKNSAGEGDKSQIRKSDQHHPFSFPLIRSFFSTYLCKFLFGIWEGERVSLRKKRETFISFSHLLLVHLFLIPLT